MTTMEQPKNFPTMIIPSGTEIAVNEHGQLSIRTPGNLVIQNSGVYSVIESNRGSVRIDPEVKVEAVSVQAADSCFVAGELTAWRVRANKITLEKGAQANIILQESESLELDRDARLVGNFASEKELYLMLGRFSRQLRDLPQNLNRAEHQPAVESAGGDPGTLTADAAEEPFPMVVPDEDLSPRDRQQRHELLSLVRVILERELGRSNRSDSTRSALEKLLEGVRAKDYRALKDGYAYQLSQVENPSDELDKARRMLEKLFG
jgi:hypothetical protein